MFLAFGICAGRAVAGEVEFGFPDQVAGWTFHPFDVEAADLDGDGDLDVVTGAHQLPWFENLADGPVPRFRPRNAHPQAVLTRSLRIADLDGDGRPDLLGTDEFRFEIRWHRNLGGSPPNFSEPRLIATVPGNLPVGIFPSFPLVVVQPADMDADGDTDIVVRSEDGGLIWLENNGASPPEFTEHAIDVPDSVLVFLLIEDIDGDGDLDPITFDFEDRNSPELNSHRVVWYENDGASPPGFTFRSHPQILSATGFPSAALDLDRDGDLDLLFISREGGMLTWYENDGASPPQFTERSIDGGADVSFARAVNVADLDGDGDEDIVAGFGYPEVTVQWWERLDGMQPAFDPVKPLGVMPHPDINDIPQLGIRTADLDGDGDIDVLASSASDADATVAWFENDGGADPTFTRRLISNAIFWGYGVASGDVDGDGDNDVLSSSITDDRLMWYDNQGGPNPWFIPHFISHFTSNGQQDPFKAHLVDLDRDGDLDIVVASTGTRTLWFENNGSRPVSFTERVISESVPACFDITTVDLDQDGDLDVITGCVGDFVIVWHENVGGSPPQFVDHPIDSPTLVGARGISPGDLDGDGDLDIIIPSGPNGRIIWLESDGGATPQFTERIVTDEGAGSSGFTADIDRDGDLDIIAGPFRDTIFWLENDGAPEPGFTKRIIADGLPALRGKIVPADINRDGHLDVLVTVSSNDFGTVIWYENDGLRPPAFLSHVILVDPSRVRSVAASDLDGDGDLDVLLVSETDVRVRWFENMLLSPFNASKTQWKLYP